MAAHPALLSSSCLVFSFAFTNRDNLAASVISSYLVDLGLEMGVAVPITSTSRRGEEGGLIVFRSVSISSSSEETWILRSVRITSLFSSVREVFAVMPMC